MIHKLFLLLLTVFLLTPLKSQTLDKEVFALLNLDFKGLEEVKKLHQDGKDADASVALLQYFKARKNVINPDVNINRIAISKEEQKWADDAMEHKFFSHEGFKEPLFYGKEIDWSYWPVHDNELRWQLHRQKWFIPMGKAYRLSKNEKYAQEWVFQYLDWVKKNPLVQAKKHASSALTKEQASMEDNKVDDDNMRYAWRPLEVSNRLQNQNAFFQYFNTSENFTPAFFTAFLVNIYKHANYLINNYSADGNHLLFEAQRILYAGILFPEFKDAPTWRKSGVDILNAQMDRQIYPDGVQFELDPMYHMAMINVFCKALQMTEMNGFKTEFPQKYKETVEKMIVAYYSLLLPDLSMPMFSDSHQRTKEDAIGNLNDWLKYFPNNQQIRYFATEGKGGVKPSFVSTPFKTAGFYNLRSSWDKDATCMIYKGGPAGEWHCQLDNGTFELMVKGRNFFPDAGSYSYGGDTEIMKMRNWFRQTRVHNTLTLNDANLEKADTKCLYWKNDGSTDVLVTENPSYKNLTHRRSVFFVDKKFYVIVDEAIGTAVGKVGIHFAMCEGDIQLDSAGCKAVTNFNDGNNLLVMAFSNQKQKMSEEEGWVSYESKQKAARKAFAFNVEKKSDAPVRFITVIYPLNNKAPLITAEFTSKKTEEKSVGVSLKIDSKRFDLKAIW